MAYPIPEYEIERQKAMAKLLAAIARKVEGKPFRLTKAECSLVYPHLEKTIKRAR